MSTVLVAGATGYLGRHIVEELHRRGRRVRAAVRDRARAEKEGPWKSPSLEGLVEEWAVGDVTEPDFAKDLAKGAAQVVSALGVTRQKADPWQIDNLANRAILASALRHGAASFTYVNVLGGEACPAKLTRAKTAFARALERAGVVSQIVNPSAYFSDMMSVLRMAKRGKVHIFDPAIRLNPIHGADLAVCICDLMEKGEKGSWDVGGPDVFTWDELARTALAAMEKQPRVGKIPTWILPPALGLTSLFSRRLADAARFATWNMLHDCVGSANGVRHLADFYAENRGLV